VRHPMVVEFAWMARLLLLSKSPVVTHY